MKNGAAAAAAEAAEAAVAPSVKAGSVAAAAFAAATAVARADMPRATFFRCKSAVDEEGIVLFTPLKWKREGWMAKWRQGE